MLIGYARISKTDKSQNLDLQLDALTEEEVQKENIYTDLISGKETSCLGLDACLKALRQGDILVAWKLDRLGMLLPHLVSRHRQVKVGRMIAAIKINIES